MGEYLKSTLSRAASAAGAAIILSTVGFAGPTQAAVACWDSATGQRCRDFGEGATGRTMVRALERPTFTGILKAGQTLTSYPGEWERAQTLKFQWLRDGVNIPGAQGETYEITAPDDGRSLTLRVTGSAPGLKDGVETTLPVPEGQCNQHRSVYGPASHHHYRRGSICVGLDEGRILVGRRRFGHLVHRRCGVTVASRWGGHRGSHHRLGMLTTKVRRPPAKDSKGDKFGRSASSPHMEGRPDRSTGSRTHLLSSATKADFTDIQRPTDQVSLVRRSTTAASSIKRPDTVRPQQFRPKKASPGLIHAITTAAPIRWGPPSFTGLASRAPLSAFRTSCARPAC